MTLDSIYSRAATALITIIILVFWGFPQTSLAAVNGEKLYQNHCARCHGDNGEGDGPAHTMQRPLPRDFTTGEYKFRSTPLKTLPTMDDVEWIVAKGNLRTSMPPFEDILNPEEIRAVSQYVLDISRKNSSFPEGENQQLVKNIDLDRTEATDLALNHGSDLFTQHCASCHGDDGRGLGAIAGFLYDKDGFWSQVPDLTDEMAYAGGNKSSDIAMRLKTGIALSKMPVFDEVLSDQEIEDVVLYVKSLQKKLTERTLIPKSKWNKALPAKVRGEYMLRAMSCSLCHNSYDADGMYDPDLYLAGGVAIKLPGLGTFYTKNITSHEDGLADWSEEEIVKVMTTGYAPDRRIEAFSMPWVFFSHLKDEDASDIATYVKSLPPIQNRVPNRLYYPFHERLSTRMKQLIGLEEGRLEYPPFNQGQVDDKKGPAS